MATARISPSFGLVEGRPLFMDEATDSYYLLEDLQEQDLLARLGGSSTGSSSEPPWHSQRVAPGPGLAPVNCPLPHWSLEEERLPRASLGAALKVWRRVARARRRLARLPISGILSELALKSKDDNDAQALVQGTLDFRSARRAVPLAQNCLIDSLALLDWLGPLRSPTTLVFAVKLEPFAAHCWVQTATLLLNDRLENIRRFTPVRAVECWPVTR